MLLFNRYKKHNRRQMVLTSMDQVLSANHNVNYRLRKVVPVSGPSDPICANTLYLSSTTPLTLGRTLSEDVHVQLLSKNTPLMISRKHASIYLSAEDNKVYIEDHKVSENNFKSMVGLIFSIYLFINLEEMFASS